METLIIYGSLILGFVLVLSAQISINSNYKKYSKQALKQKLTGQEIARKILDANGLENIHVVEVNGELTDHYDPTRKVVRLSNGVYGEETLAAASIAAHECGHAIQDKEGYSFMRIRAALVPFVNFVSYLGYFGLVVSIFAGITGYLKLSILILVATIIFQLVTLPVEFDASRRAKQQLLSLGLVDNDEHAGTDKMLKSAALTYVAGLLSNLLNLLRLVILLGNRDD